MTSSAVGPSPIPKIVLNMPAMGCMMAPTGSGRKSPIPVTISKTPPTILNKKKDVNKNDRQ